LVEIYLDNNATTQILPEVREAILEILNGAFGNASSAHKAGERSREAIWHARQQVAEFLHCEPDQLLFTASGTEANNLVLRSFAGRVGSSCHLVTSVVEHSSILRCCDVLEEKGHDVLTLGVDRYGQLRLEEFEAALTNNISLVSLQWVNNETGVVQPIGEITRICHQRNIPIHVDAAQAVGKLCVDLEEIGIDYLTLSGHKFHGPVGVGVLFARDHSRLHPIIYGGMQENGLRAGTENVAAIVGLGVASEIRNSRLDTILPKLANWRRKFEAVLSAGIPDISINGGNAARIDNSTNILFRGIDGQALVAQLDQLGVFCSQSSACTNMRPEPSYVLRAMGLSVDEAYSSVRFSFSELNTEVEILDAAKRIIEICSRLRLTQSVRDSCSFQEAI